MPEPVTLVGVGGGLLLLTTQMARRYFDLAKEIVDVLLGAIALVLFAPLMGLCALLIRLSSQGPVLYRQVRVGKDGVHFTMYKFRTMRTDAEAEGARWAVRGDSRIIPACRWMRLSHVDELPQLINVIKGDMSLVGPRPERPEMIAQIKETVPDFDQRLKVRPGITGLAQVRNGYDGSVEGCRRKLAADLEYIHQRKWSLEFRILAATFAKFHDKGAS